MVETWKAIRGFEGKYEISSKGRVRSLPRSYHYGQIEQHTYLKYGIARGYARVTLFRDGKRFRYQVHRLVALTFIPSVPGKPFINHINEDKLDNSIENLEWCTAKENCNHGSRGKRIANAVSKQIHQYDQTGQILKTWPSITCASKALGVSISAISAALKLPNRKSANSFWRYKHAN